MPHVRCYLRVSTIEQENGLDAQRAKMAPHKAGLLGDPGMLDGGEYIDQGVSGSIPIADRPAGSKLAADLERGDVALFAKLDRGFRNAADLCMTLDAWVARGVRIILLDLGVDTATPVGGLIAKIIGAVAEFERKMIGLRTKEVAARLKAQGLPHGGPPPYGMKIERRQTSKGVWRKVFVPNKWQRHIGKSILAWRRQGWTEEAIYFHLLTTGIRNNKGGEIGTTAIRTAIREEERLEREEADKASQP